MQFKFTFKGGCISKRINYCQFWFWGFFLGGMGVGEGGGAILLFPVNKIWQKYNVIVSRQVQDTVAMVRILLF